MKSRKFHKILVGQNTQQNSTRLNDYKYWLQDKNFTKETIENYLATIVQYGKRTIDTVSIKE